MVGACSLLSSLIPIPTTVSLLGVSPRCCSHCSRRRSRSLPFFYHGSATFSQEFLPENISCCLTSLWDLFQWEWPLLLTDKLWHSMRCPCSPPKHKVPALPHHSFGTYGFLPEPTKVSQIPNILALNSLLRKSPPRLHRHGSCLAGCQPQCGQNSYMALFFPDSLICSFEADPKENSSLGEEKQQQQKQQQHNQIEATSPWSSPLECEECFYSNSVCQTFLIPNRSISTVFCHWQGNLTTCNPTLIQSMCRHSSTCGRATGACN